jgi:hypothetical protein
MKRNRKRRVHASMMPKRWVSVLMALAFFAIGYVLLDSMCGTLSERIRALETEQEDVAFKLRREQNRWAMMITAEQIDLALNRHGLNMLLPRGEQVVRLQVTPGDGVYRPRDQFANRR